MYKNQTDQHDSRVRIFTPLLVILLVILFTVCNMPKAKAWQIACAPVGEPEYETLNILDLSTNDGDGMVVEFYDSVASTKGSPEQQATIINTLGLVRGDLRPLFEKLPQGRVLVTFAATIGYAFDNAVVLNVHAEASSNYLIHLFLHELGHVWESNMLSQEGRTLYQQSLPWYPITTDWRSAHLDHFQRPIEAYANDFMSNMQPCHTNT